MWQRLAASQVDPLGACSHAQTLWPFGSTQHLDLLNVYSHMASCIEHVHLGVHP